MAELEFLKSLWGLGTEEEWVIVPARQATQAGGIHSLESIPGLHKRLKIPDQGTESLILHTWGAETENDCHLAGRH